MLNLCPNFSFMQIDCDKNFMVTLKHDDKLQDGSECAFQVLESLLLNFIPRGFRSSVHPTLKVVTGWKYYTVVLIIYSPTLQCALLYTTLYGQRRIRVVTLSLPVTSMLSNLFRAADLDTQFCCFLKQGIHHSWLCTSLNVILFLTLIFARYGLLLTALCWILLALYIVNDSIVVSSCSYFR